MCKPGERPELDSHIRRLEDYFPQVPYRSGRLLQDEHTAIIYHQEGGTLTASKPIILEDLEVYTFIERGFAHIKTLLGVGINILDELRNGEFDEELIHSILLDNHSPSNEPLKALVKIHETYLGGENNYENMILNLTALIGMSLVDVTSFVEPVRERYKAKQGSFADLVMGFLKHEVVGYTSLLTTKHIVALRKQAVDYNTFQGLLQNIHGNLSTLKFLVPYIAHLNDETPVIMVDFMDIVDRLTLGTTVNPYTNISPEINDIEVHPHCGIGLGVITQILITNSVKYADPQKTGEQYVYLSANKVGEVIGIEVCDNGIGIAEEKRARIFEKDFRGVGEMDKIPGTGLGLYLAREIARTLGWSIRLDSSKENTTFRLSIPTQTLNPDASEES